METYEIVILVGAILAPIAVTLPLMIGYADAQEVDDGDDNL